MLREGAIEFEVPWGKLSGKTWGNPDGIPALMLHGIMDNCGTFDLLVPHLPSGFYWVCFDLPGHGKSSPFTSGLPLQFWNYVYVVNKIVDYLSWDKFYMVGHSLGAQLSLVYSSVYPEKVEKIVLIDGMTPYISRESQSASFLRGYFDKTESIEKGLTAKAPPSFTYEEALNRILNNRTSKVTREAAECLLKRALVQSGDGFRFVFDQRLKPLIKPLLSIKQLTHLIISVKCPILLLIADRTLKNLEGVHPLNLYPENVLKVLEQFNQMKVHVIPGNHDVHLNTPAAVAAYINPFLTSIKSTL